jgi:alcohol dehydrogenase class IV
MADAVIVDPQLTVNLPQKITADTGVDAFTHALEAYTSAKANIFSDMFSETALKLIASNIRTVYTKDSKNLEARYNMAVAASLAMHSVVLSGAGLIHFMGESLGKKAHVSHGTTCGILLPYVLEFNYLGNPEKFAKLTEIMGENIQGLSCRGAAEKSIYAVKKVLQDLARIFANLI